MFCVMKPVVAYSHTEGKVLCIFIVVHLHVHSMVVSIPPGWISNNHHAGLICNKQLCTHIRIVRIQLFDTYMLHGFTVSAGYTHPSNNDRVSTYIKVMPLQPLVLWSCIMLHKRTGILPYNMCAPFLCRILSEGITM